ncbi:mitochondrial carnitine/acylcarnitine carrier protein-like [Rhopilema esculentum]|uniref:mitochondrial carnitine/acylcarnitine carrier protein-like n=1 Tax=Rhopilema esculentum TaxID=499914 RepID=UPI0031DE435A
MKKKHSNLKNFISGGAGGISLVFAGHPLDTIKVRLQTQPHPKFGELPQFNGLLDCAYKTIKNEGFRGLYKGMGTPLLIATPMCAVGFWGYGVGRALQTSRDSLALSNFQILKAGMLSGFLISFMNAPGERIKCLLQVQKGSGSSKVKFKGPVHCAVQIYKESGLRKGLYKGLGFTLLRDIPASGAYFVTYEYAIRNLGIEGKSKSPWKIILAGGSAGILANIVGLPADVMKSRYQTAPADKYRRGLMNIAMQTLREEGLQAFFRGATPMLARAFPANAACFLGYEAATMLQDKFF